MSPGASDSGPRRRISASRVASAAYLPRSEFAQAWTRLLGDGTARRRNRVALELLGVVLFCTIGFYALSEPVRLLEVPFIVNGLHLLGCSGVASLGTNIVVQSPEGLLVAAVTPSCSALLSVLALTALAGSLFRSRGWRTVRALLATSVLLVLANAVRIGASVALGTVLGSPALSLFHDWVGTIANFIFTLTGFVVMVWLLLPDSIRAEQDRYGRHTANRPVQWAESGFGYRTTIPQKDAHMSMKSPVAWMYRLYPHALRERAARRREAKRVDFRVGGLEPSARAAALREMVSDGLAVHAATLWAAASFETDPEVLDALADAVAARQWEPTVNDKVGGIRLW
ncbi:MAG: exosortase/archaeosortase family protein, partial [Candidatus Nanopelagicales bacterium]